MSDSRRRETALRAIRWVLAGTVFTGWVTLSFDGLAELGRQVVGWSTGKALLLPLTVDALAALAFIDHALYGRRRAMVVAIAAAGVSVAGNGAAWLYAQGMISVTAVAVILVAGIAPAAGVVALDLLTRDDGRAEPSTPGTTPRAASNTGSSEAGFLPSSSPKASSNGSGTGRGASGSRTIPRRSGGATAAGSASPGPDTESMAQLLAGHPRFEAGMSGRAVERLIRGEQPDGLGLAIKTERVKVVKARAEELSGSGDPVVVG